MPKKYLKKMQYHWFFLWMFVLALVYLLKEPGLLSGLLFILIVIRILFLGSRVRVSVIFLVVLVLLSNQASVTRESKYQSLKETSGDLLVKVDPFVVEDRGGRLFGKAILLFQDLEIPVQLSYPYDDFEYIQDKEQIWLVEAELSRVDEARNFGVFSYKKYLEQNDIYWQVKVENVKAKKYLNSPPPQTARRRLRAYLRSFQDRSLYPLYLRMFWNINTSAFRENTDELKTYGVMHLFVLSGMHFSILSRMLRHILLRLGVLVEVTDVLVDIIMLAYAYLIGAPLGILRVLGVYHLNKFSKKHKLAISRLDVLSIVGISFLLIKPKLIYSLAYQLSFGLTCVMQFYRQVSTVKNKHLKDLEQSLVMLTFIWAILLESQQEIQLLHVVVVPLFSKLVSYIYPIFIVVFTILMLINYTPPSNVDFSLPTEFLKATSVVIGDKMWFKLGLFVVAIAFLYILVKNRKKAYIFLASAYLILFSMLQVRLNSRVLIIDVGQGDSLLYQPAYSNRNWLIDTGGKLAFSKDGVAVDESHAKKVLLPALKAAGVKKLTGVIITHPDLDHCGNLEQLSKNMEIEKVYMTEYASKNSMFKNINTKKLELLKPLTVYKLKDFSILAPLDIRDDLEEDASNNSSLVTWWNLGENTFMNMGDLGKKGELSLIELMPDLKADLLKLGHHGSSTSTDETFIKHNRPKLALISAGYNNRYNHPHQEVLDILEKYDIKNLSTKEYGAIELSYNFIKGISVRTVLNGE